MSGIRRYDLPEFVGQIIDIFEDFLEERGVTLQNPDLGEDENAAILYGSDYGDLQSQLEAVMDQWGLITSDRDL